MFPDDRSPAVQLPFRLLDGVMAMLASLPRLELAVGGAFFALLSAA